MSKKILVVDDDPVVTKLVVTLLTSAGYEVFSAVDGLDALVQIKNEDPDLVVLDIIMPEFNGYDVCYQLRFNDEFKKIPIVLLTETDKAFDEKIEDRTNIQYVPKPVNSNDLLEKVKSLLSK